MNNIQQLEPILKDLYHISGLNMSIFDSEYHLVASYPHCKSPFCSLIDQNPHSLKYCHQYDLQAFEKAKETRNIYIYQCHFHLYEAVVPLYDFEILSGYLMMGQTLTNSQFDREAIEKAALPYVQNTDALKRAINKISVHPKEQILSFASIVNICAEYITLTHRMKSHHKDLADEIKTYITQYFHTQITIDKLCQYFYCSKATLINTFQNKYHQSIHQFLTLKRMEKAIELLSYSTITIQEIALKCGFQDANYFSKTFKKIYHISPSVYRKTKK